MREGGEGGGDIDYNQPVRDGLPLAVSMDRFQNKYRIPLTRLRSEDIIEDACGKCRDNACVVSLARSMPCPNYLPEKFKMSPDCRFPVWIIMSAGCYEVSDVDLLRITLFFEMVVQF